MFSDHLFQIVTNEEGVRRVLKGGFSFILSEAVMRVSVEGLIKETDRPWSFYRGSSRFGTKGGIAWGFR